MRVTAGDRRALDVKSVRVDGVEIPLHDCYFADDRKGVVRVYVNDDIGNRVVLRLGTDRAKLKTKTLRGKIEIEFANAS